MKDSCQAKKQRYDEEQEPEADAKADPQVAGEGGSRRTTESASLLSLQECVCEWALNPITRLFCRRATWNDESEV